MYESMYNYVGTLFYSSYFLCYFVFSRDLLLAFPQFIFLDVSHLGCVVLGKNHNRMTRGGSSSDAHADTPVRRSAQQAGHSPEPYVPPPPNPPSTKQILRMFEERRNNDLIEILRCFQVVVG